MGRLEERKGQKVDKDDAVTGREQMSESGRVVKVMPCPGHSSRPRNFPAKVNGCAATVRARMRSVRVPLAGRHKGDEASETERCPSVCACQPG